MDMKMMLHCGADVRSCLVVCVHFRFSGHTGLNKTVIELIVHRKMLSKCPVSQQVHERLSLTYV